MKEDILGNIIKLAPGMKVLSDEIVVAVQGPDGTAKPVAHVKAPDGESLDVKATGTGIEISSRKLEP